jgi:hypothetical protein
MLYHHRFCKNHLALSKQASGESHFLISPLPISRIHYADLELTS